MFRSIPYTPCMKPLNEMTISIVTTAGVHLKDQSPFHLSRMDPDISYRVISKGVDTGQLTVTNAAPLHEYDCSKSKEDINTIFPIDRLKELADQGFVGGVAQRHYSLMGYLLRFNKLITETLPKLVKKIVRSDTDGVILSAGSPYCHRTVVVVQRVIETFGIPTVLVTLDTHKSGLYRPPRALCPLGFSIGHSFGNPGDTYTQSEVLKQALKLLVERQEPGIIHKVEFSSYNHV
jgi:D-proline reductase (dithiol) PrdB